MQTAEGASSKLSALYRSVPLGRQIGIGLLSAAIALAVAQALAWPGAVTWLTAPLVLLAVTISAAGAGIAAGMTCVVISLLYYGAAFATAGLSVSMRNLAWLPLLALAAVCIAGIVGWLRESLGRLERELSGTRTMLQGANNRLATVLESERLRSYYDHVTDLPSRRMVVDRFTQMAAQARRNDTLVALLLLDLRNFKEVNALVGHDAGDEVLREIGQRLSAVMRQSDTVGRLHSDTFVVLLSGLTDPAAVTVAAHKIAEALDPPFPVGSPPRLINVGADLGAAVFPRDGEDWDDLRRFAQASLRTAGQMA